MHADLDCNTDLCNMTDSYKAVVVTFMEIPRCVINRHPIIIIITFALLRIKTTYE